jgi:hypothetical protein
MRNAHGSCYHTEVGWTNLPANCTVIEAIKICKKSFSGLIEPFALTDSASDIAFANAGFRSNDDEFSVPSVIVALLPS